MDEGELYADTRRRIIELVRALDADALDRPVPACPGWQVRDVIAHLSAIPADAAAGNLDGVATDPWTDRQVQQRKGRALADLLADWEAHAPAFEALLPAAGILGAMAVTDVATHEQDLRGALGAPGAADNPALDFGLQGYVFMLDQRLRERSLPALRLVAGDQEWTVGEGEPAATVRTSAYELFRSLSGRRSPGQVRAYRWEGDPTPYVAVWGNFGTLAATDVVEAV